MKGYDVRDILDSEAVESYDLRSHYGAYIEGHPAMEYGYEQDVNSGEKTDIWFTRSNNVIRFKIQGAEPVALEYNPDESYTWGWRPFYLEILDDTDKLIFYPDVEYIAILGSHISWGRIGKAGTWEYLDRGLYDDQFAFAKPVQDYTSICYLSDL